MIFRLACMVIVAVRVLEGCGENRQMHSRIDVRWHPKTLEKEHLERWLHLLPTDSGIFIN